MDEKRPPDVDAEYRVVRGAWPRWAWQMGLAKLALWTAAVVALCILFALVIVWALRPR